MTTNPKQDPEQEHRPFATWLLEQAGGRTHDELGEGLRDLVARVKDTGKKGSVTLTVKVGLLDKDPNILVISDEIKLNLPEHDRKASIFYTDPNGDLTRNDPNQLTIYDDVRDLPDRDVDVRDTTTGRKETA